MKRDLRPHVVTFGVCAVAALAMWIATAVYLSQVERATRDEASARRHSLARSLAEYEASSVRAIDLSLVYLRELWHRSRSDFGTAVRAHEDLLQKERVIQIAVLDAEGWLRYSRLPQAGDINFSDREYFTFHRGAAAQDELHINAPVLGRVTQRWAIQFSRALRDDAGKFAGLVVVAVPPPALEAVYKDMDLGADGVVTLSRTDGRILARSAEFERTVNSRLSTWASVAAQGNVAGEFVGHGGLDGIERQFSYRKIPEYGLAVLVGQSSASVMAPYQKQRNYVLVLVTAATFFLFAVGGVVMLRLRDRSRYLAQHESLMHELHDGCIQAIYAVGLRLQSARLLAGGDPGVVARMIAEAEADLNLVIQDLRAFIGGARPPRYTAGEFLAQLQRSIPTTHRDMFDLDIDADVATALPPEKSEHVLRIVREAATNVARHAGARSARVSLQRAEAGVRLRIDDDGRGHGQPSAAESGLGLAHIHARARKLGGVARVESTQGRGTQVTVEFPG